MTSLLTTATISEITRQTWTAFLTDIDPAPPGADAAPEVDALTDGEAVTASVEITGAWNGSVHLTCSRAAARCAAAAMYALDDEVVGESEIRDAVGELVNVVGGNIKSLVPAPTDLSLPSIDDATPAPPSTAAQLAVEACFVWTDEPVTVRIWETTSQGREADADG